MFRGFPAKIALLAGLMPAVLPVAAQAQVNIDAGKSSAEIYASDCATCHKSPRGLAAGKNSLMLSSFLREHYTASRDQASALAAYVLGAGGAEPAAKPKPDVEHARAEEAKPGEAKGESRGEAKGEAKGAKTGEARAGETKPGQPKTAAHPTRAASTPEEKRVPEEETKQEQHPAPAAGEDHASETAKREPGHEPAEAAPAAREPGPVATAPAPHEPPATVAVSSTSPSSVSATAGVATGDGTRSALPSLELGSSLDAKPPAEDQPSVATTVPRDNIPD